MPPVSTGSLTSANAYIGSSPLCLRRLLRSSPDLQVTAGDKRLTAWPPHCRLYIYKLKGCTVYRSFFIRPQKGESSVYGCRWSGRRVMTGHSLCPLNFHRGYTLCKGDLGEFHASLKTDESRSLASGSTTLKAAQRRC